MWQQNKYVGPPYCQAEMYAGYMTCCPLVSYGEYADWTERLLHYALRYERGQRNNKSRRLSHNILQYIFSKLQIKHCECSSSTSFFPLSSYSFIIQLLIYFHVFLASLAQQRLYLHSRSKSQLHTISLSLCTLVGIGIYRVSGTPLAVHSN